MANIKARLKARIGTSAAWAAANPVLLAGEIALESDTKRIRFGDGATAYTSLPFVNLTATGYQVATATLTSLGGLGSGANKGLYTTGPNTFAEFDLPATSRSFLAAGSSVTALRNFLSAQLANANLDDISALGDPGGNRVLGWDDALNEFAWFNAGAGISFAGKNVAASSVDLNQSLKDIGATLAIGAYVLASRGTTTTALHAEVAGSELTPCGVLRSASFSISNGGSGISAVNANWQAGGSGSLSGTWACRGRIGTTSSGSGNGSSESSSLTAATLWQRVA